MTSALELSAPSDLGHIRAVCLDVDDTLLDNERSSRAALTALLGNDAGWPVWRRITDEYYARLLAGEFDFDTMRLRRTGAFFAAFGERLSEAELLEREHRRMLAMQRAWRLFDDAAPCLEWLRACGLRLAVITNAPGGYQRKKIASVGLAGAFDEVLISGELGMAKPDPGIFEAACDALGMAPGEVAHVGDRLDLDARAAVRAGMHGIWLNRDGTTVVGQGPPADVPTITGLGGLPEVLVCDLQETTVRTEACEVGTRGEAVCSG